jgi:hypothetical protein
VFSPAGAAADSAARPCSPSSVNALVSRCSGPAVRAMGCAMERPPLGIALNDYTDEPGAAVFRHACRMGLRARSVQHGAAYDTKSHHPFDIDRNRPRERRVYPSNALRCVQGRSGLSSGGS